MTQTHVNYDCSPATTPYPALMNHLILVTNKFKVHLKAASVISAKFWLDSGSPECKTTSSKVFEYSNIILSNKDSNFEKAFQKKSDLTQPRLYVMAIGII